jgi:hypothetical protein
MVETLHLKRLEDTQNPFKDLAITPGHKKVIWSLVHSHFEKRKMEQAHFFHDISQDIIHNKGKGLVLLLDEADVFRSQRQPSGLQRNSLVSGKYYKDALSKIVTNLPFQSSSGS